MGLLFYFIGMYYSMVFSKGAALLIFLLCLFQVLLFFTLNFDTNIRKAIAFNISGPVCLGLASLYTFRRKMAQEINMTLLSMGLPIVSCMVYLTLYTPNIRDVITSTQSNFETSGGYGPTKWLLF
jgi:hypothetical protein